MPIYHLAIAFDIETKMLKGTAVVELQPDAALSFSLDSLEVTSMEVNGKQMPLSSNQLVIDASPSPQKITIHYSKRFGRSASGFISDTGIALTGVWHPIPDKKCIFSLQATVPANLTAISEADTIRQETSGLNRTTDFEFSQPLYRLHFVAGPYDVKEQVIADNGVIVASYFFEEDKELAEHYRDKAQGYILRYEKLIGPYPYKRFSIVENRFPTGYAMPSLTLLGQMVVRLPFIVDTSLGHEVLHSWFGNAVDVDHSEGNWCEGLTTFLADQAYAEEEGKGAEYRKNQLLKNQNYAHGEEAISLKEFTGGDGSRDPKHLAKNAVGYGKAAMLFHMLSLKIGNENFVSGIRAFYQNMKGETASWADIEESFNQYGEDIDTFFDQWLTRTGMPGLTVKDLALDETNGDLKLSFTMEQDSEEPYVLDVPIVLSMANSQIFKNILLSEKSQKVEFKLSDYPLSLFVDPDFDVVRKVSGLEVPPTWDWFKGADNKIAVIGTSSDYDLYEPLINEVESQGAEIIAANEVDDAMLAENAVLFFGITSPVVRSQFSKPNHPESGFVVDIRKNPMNPDYPAVLISASSIEEVQQGIAKLKHYGKYCYLHFEGGRAKTKNICVSANGIGYGLDRPPLAVEVTKAKGFADIVDQLMANRVVYVGESHTRYADHKLQLRIIREMHKRDPKLAIGMEMFPRSSQEVLDKFIAGEISEAQFLKDSKYYDVWRFDYRLYREILNFAQSRDIPVIGLNIEKKYVSKIYKEGGVSGLGPEELMELPVDRDLDVLGYRDRIYSTFRAHPGQKELKQFNGFFQAQAIWDEIMAETISGYIKDHKQHRMVVVAGKGHVVKENAIPPRVERRTGVAQAIVLSSDGSELYPPEVDYVVFMPNVQMPKRALMGIVMTEDKKNKSVLVDKVGPHTSASKVDIRPKDILVSLDGEKVESIEDVKIFMLGKKIGETLLLEIRRDRVFFDDEIIEFKLQL